MDFLAAAATSSSTADNEHFRPFPKPTEVGSLISIPEVQEWCSSGLLLPVTCNLDTLDMALIKSLMLGKGDFFNLGGVPSFTEEEMQKALSDAIQMVDTLDKPLEKKDDKESVAVAGSKLLGCDQTDIPVPNSRLVQILLGNEKSGKVTSVGSGDDVVLINESGRPTQVAIAMLQNMDDHLSSAAGKEEEEGLLTKIRDEFKKVFGKEPPDLAVPTSMDNSLASVKLADALTRARMAGDRIDTVLIARLLAQGFSQKEVEGIMPKLKEEIQTERYAPNVIKVEGESEGAVMNALRNLRDAYTKADAKYDKFVRRMVLIRRLITGTDVTEGTKDPATQQAAAEAAAKTAEAEEKSKEGTAEGELDKTAQKAAEEAQKLAAAAEEARKKAVQAMKKINAKDWGKHGLHAEETGSSELPPLVVEQLKKVREFQVGLGTQGMFDLQLDSAACGLKGIIANSHYWITSGLFVSSGAIGPMTAVCSTIGTKLYSYDSSKLPGGEGKYTISNVRRALANAIKEGSDKPVPAKGGAAKSKPKTRRAFKKRRKSRRRKKKVQGARSRRRRKPLRHTRGGGRKCTPFFDRPQPTTFGAMPNN